MPVRRGIEILIGWNVPSGRFQLLDLLASFDLDHGASQALLASPLG